MEELMKELLECKKQHLKREAELASEAEKYQELYEGLKSKSTKR